MDEGLVDGIGLNGESGGSGSDEWEGGGTYRFRGRFKVGGISGCPAATCGRNMSSDGMEDSEKRQQRFAGDKSGVQREGSSVSSGRAKVVPVGVGCG